MFCAKKTIGLNKPKYSTFFMRARIPKKTRRKQIPKAAIKEKNAPIPPAVKCAWSRFLERMYPPSYVIKALETSPDRRTVKSLLLDGLDNKKSFEARKLCLRILVKRFGRREVIPVLKQELEYPYPFEKGASEFMRTSSGLKCRSLSLEEYTEFVKKILKKMQEKK